MLLRSTQGGRERSGDRRLFLLRGIRQPRQICSVMPSSPGVGQAMVRAVAGRPVPTVVELGPGTGPVTAELIAGGVDPSALTAVELDATLAGHLASRFAGIEVLNMGAQSLSALWRSEGRDKVGGIVSTLPLRIFDQAQADAVLRSVFDILAPGGRFVQFTYRFASPVARETIDRFSLVARRTEIVWHNLPPAAIWAYSRTV